MKKCTLLVFLFFTLFCFGQNKPKEWYLIQEFKYTELPDGDKILVDSLLTIYHSTSADSVKLYCLTQLVDGLASEDALPQYNELILKLTENKNSAMYLRYYAAALNNMGFFADVKGNTSSALGYYNKALQLREKSGDKFGIAESLHNIASMYQDRGNIRNAEDYFVRALAAENSINDKSLKPNTLNKLGDIYLQQSKYKEALTCFEQSVQLAEISKNKRLIAGAYTKLGDIYSTYLNTAKAIDCYTIAIKSANESADKSRRTNAYKGLSKLYLNQKKYDLAEKNGLIAFGIANELASPKNIRNTSELLYQIYKKQNRVTDALFMHELYMKMRDSINNEEQAKAFADIEFGAKEAQLKAENEKQSAIAAEESKRQKTILWSVSGILALVLVLVVFVLRSNNQKKKANILISKQKEEVEQHQKEIIDSINYAKRIQQAIFKEEEYVSAHLPPHFILFKPKDIVSGDFYWAFEKGDYFYFAAGDCTGHGVPGAFLTMLGISFLNEVNAKEETLTPAEILDQLRAKVVKELGRQGQTKDGMDISLTRLNLKTKELMWAGANNPLWYMSDNNLEEIKPDKQPIGYSEKVTPFTNHILNLNSTDTFYLFTDGFADQFGGVKGKKYKYKQLKELLLANCNLPLEEQKQILNKTFEAWKGDLEQVDDVVVIGLRLA